MGVTERRRTVGSRIHTLKRADPAVGSCIHDLRAQVWWFTVQTLFQLGDLLHLGRGIY